MSGYKIFKSSLCSCIICKKLTSAKGIFSHHLSLHTAEGNKKTIENGILGGNATRLKYQNYVSNNKKFANLCQECSLPCLVKFCNRSCAAKYNNKLRPAGHISRLQGKESRSNAIRERNKNKFPKYTKISCCKNCKIWFEGRKKTCSNICLKTLLSNVAKNNPKLGGNKNTRAFGWYDSPIAGKVWLESSYEYKVACELDKNNIDWVRPKYLLYGNKKYYADFYLTKYDVYLDPKNDFLIKTDYQKIKEVIKQNNVKILILDKNYLTWQSILSVLATGFEPAMRN